MANHDLHTSELITSALDGAASFSDLLNEFSALIGPAPSFDLLPPQICAFCHNILVNAITVVCGHTHCLQCVENRTKCWCGVEIGKPGRSRRNIVISNTVQQLFPKHVKFELRVDELEKLNLTAGQIIETLAREHLFSTDSRYCNFLQGLQYLSSHELNLAFVFFQLVLEKDPSLAYVWCYQAETLAKQEKYVKSLARLLVAFWLDPFIPHATKLANDVFKMARMERATKHTEFGQQVSVITKNSHLQDDGESGVVRSNKLLQKVQEMQQLDTDNRVTFNPITGVTRLPDFSQQNKPTTVIQGCTMSVISDMPNAKRKRTFDQVDVRPFMELSFLTDFKRHCVESNLRVINRQHDETNGDIVDQMSVKSLGAHLRQPSTLLKAESDDSAAEIEHFHAGDLECPLCLRIYWEPDVTPCGHTFCGNCLERTLDHDPKCPLCKQSLVEFLEMRQPQQGGRRTDQKLTRIIQRYLPDEFAERQTAAQEEEAEMLERLPIFVCTLAFPGVPCPLHVFEPRHRLLLRRCMRNRGGEFGMNLPRTEPGDIPFERIGTKLLVQNANYFRDGRVVVESVGVGRFKVNEVEQIDGYDSATFVAIIDQPPKKSELSRLGDLLNQVHNKANEWFHSLPPDMSAALVRHFGPMPTRADDASEFTNVDGPAWPWWVLAVIPAEDKIKMHVLAQTSLAKRLTLMSRVIACIITQSSSAPR